MIVVVRLPDLTLADLRKLELGKLERHACANVRWLRSQRLTIDEVLILDVGRQG